MTDEQDELFDTIKKYVTKKDAKRLKTSITNATDEKRNAISFLPYKKAEILQGLNKLTAFIGTLFGFIFLLLSIIFLTVVSPICNAKSKFLTAVSEDTKYLYKVSTTKDDDVNGMEEQNDLISDVISAQYSTLRESYEEELSDSLKAYSEKYTEYESAVSYVNDKYNNYLLYELNLDECQKQLAALDSTAADYEVKKKDLEDKIAACQKNIETYNNYVSSLNTLKTEAENLYTAYINKYPDANMQLATYNNEYEASFEAIEKELGNEVWTNSTDYNGIIKVWTDSTDYNGIVKEMRNKIKKLQDTFALYLSAANTYSNYLAYYQGTGGNDAASLQKDIEEISESASKTQTIIDSLQPKHSEFTSDINTFLTAHLTTYNEYVEVAIEYAKLQKELETARTNAATKESEATKSALETAEKALADYTPTYKTKKEAYELAESMLNGYKLNGYAATYATVEANKTDTTKSDETKKSDSENLIKYETRITAYLNLKDSTVSEYIEMSEKYSDLLEKYSKLESMTDDEIKEELSEEERKIKSDYDYYKDWCNGEKSCNNLVFFYQNKLSKSENNIKSLLQETQFNIADTEYDLASFYYKIQELSNWLKAHVNILNKISASTLSDLKEICEQSQIAKFWRIDESDRAELLNEINYDEVVKSLTAYIAALKNYDLSEDDFGEFDISDYASDKFSETVNNVKKVMTTEDETTLKCKVDLDAFFEQMKKISEISASADTCAGNYNSTSFFLETLMMVYDIVMCVILVAYFIGNIGFTVYETKKENAKLIDQCLKN